MSPFLLEYFPLTSARQRRTLWYMLKYSKRVSDIRKQVAPSHSELLELLNEGCYSKLVVRILECINEVNIEDWTPTLVLPRGLHGSVYSLPDRLNQLLEEMNRLIRRIPRPVCLYKVPLPDLRKQWAAAVVDERLTQSRQKDAHVLQELLVAAGNGNLDKLRSCVCGIWFIQRVRDQRFHSAKCREKAFKSSPQWKAYRREKAREYYWLHKNKNVK